MSGWLRPCYPFWQHLFRSAWSSGCSPQVSPHSKTFKWILNTWPRKYETGKTESYLQTEKYKWVDGFATFVEANQLKSMKKCFSKRSSMLLCTPAFLSVPSDSQISSFSGQTVGLLRTAWVNQDAFQPTENAWKGHTNGLPSGHIARRFCTKSPASSSANIPATKGSYKQFSFWAWWLLENSSCHDTPLINASFLNHPRVCSRWHRCKCE